ncbi:MAG: glutamate--tRNA ligase [Candidatus Moraniibacteriota bacterium]
MPALSVRVRLAPSPTGYMHVGTARTALYNYLFAKKEQGTFLVRIEDTDRERLVHDAEERLLKNLLDLHIQPDEGRVSNGKHVSEVGEYGPYIQSERLAIYRKHADDLVTEGQAYPCFCTAERLDALRKEQQVNKQAPKYDKHCLALSSEEVGERLKNKESHVIRLNVDPQAEDIIFDDLIRGEVRFQSKDIDDQVLMKSDGFPTYHLASVVDDHLMAISHVIRGEEWLPSTPKHILLYQAFDWQPPAFAHIPLLLNPGGGKLSKRQGDVAVDDFLRDGYLPEALINFLALLGWNPGAGSTQEIFTMDELVAQFDLAQVHKAGAVFDVKKLDWMNGEYIKKLSLDDLYMRLQQGSFLDKPLIAEAPQDLQGEIYIKKVLAVEQERLTRLDQVGEENPFFFTATLEYPAERLVWKKSSPEESLSELKRVLELAHSLPEGEWEHLESLEQAFLGAAGDDKGVFLWPLRVALTGAERSPSPFQVAWVLGRSNSLARLEQAIKRLS